MRRIPIALALSLTVACGANALDDAGFLRVADRLCDDLQKRLAAQTTDDPATFYEEAAAINVSGAQQLGGLAPPEPARARMAELLSQIYASAGAMYEASSATRRGDAAGRERAEAKIRTARGEIATAAKELGLTRCTAGST